MNKQLFKLGRINHVAIATNNLEKSVNFYKNILGAQVSEAKDLPEHGVTTVFVNTDTIEHGSGEDIMHSKSTKIELLRPLGDKSPIQNFLNKQKDGGIHHICIEVDDIDKACERVSAMGIRILGESVESKIKIGAHNKRVAFLHPKDCGNVLVELENIN
ncbi:hypothetical protein MP228_004801 [Amoeboaphelidium protococcarum]|nr:hypothetical protein MP228_004801 [Amoeboaphelidium protococcarum]